MNLENIQVVVTRDGHYLQYRVEENVYVKGDWGKYSWPIFLEYENTKVMYLSAFFTNTGLYKIEKVQEDVGVNIFDNSMAE